MGCDFEKFLINIIKHQSAFVVEVCTFIATGSSNLPEVLLNRTDPVIQAGSQRSDAASVEEMHDITVGYSREAGLEGA